MKTRFEWDVQRDDNNKITDRYATIYVIGNSNDSEDEIFAYAKEIITFFEDTTWFTPIVDFFDIDENSVMILFGSCEPSDRLEIKEGLADFKRARKEALKIKNAYRDVVEAAAEEVIDEAEKTVHSSNDEATEVSAIDETTDLCGATHKEIVDFAKAQLAYWWGLDLKVDIEINTRFSKSLGRYSTINDKPLSLEFSKRLFEHYPNHIIQEVVLHELCHYACHVLGRGYHDKDLDFKQEIKRIGSHESGTVKYRSAN